MLELLSLTSNNDLVLAKIDNYYLCLVEPSKRKYGLNWYEANNYCKSLGEDYSLPSKEELNLIYTNKGSLSLVEACLYETNINTLDFISIYPTNTNQHKDFPYVWSSTESNSNSSSSSSSNYAWVQFFIDGCQFDGSKSVANSWFLPVRRVFV